MSPACPNQMSQSSLLKWLSFAGTTSPSLIRYLASRSCCSAATRIHAVLCSNSCCPSHACCCLGACCWPGRRSQRDKLVARGTGDANAFFVALAALIAFRRHLAHMSSLPLWLCGLFESLLAYACQGHLVHSGCSSCQVFINALNVCRIGVAHCCSRCSLPQGSWCLSSTLRPIHHQWRVFIVPFVFHIASGRGGFNEVEVRISKQHGCRKQLARSFTLIILLLKRPGHSGRTMCSSVAPIQSRLLIVAESGVDIVRHMLITRTLMFHVFAARARKLTHTHAQSCTRIAHKHLEGSMCPCVWLCWARILLTYQHNGITHYWVTCPNLF